MTKSRFQRWVAFHMPRWLVTWCTIRLFGYATQTKYSKSTPDSVNLFQALDCWEGK